MLVSFLSKWMHEGSSRPLLGRWCHVTYNTSCDPIRKAELNTNDHGFVLVHAKSYESKKAKKEEIGKDPTWVSSGFGM